MPMNTPSGVQLNPNIGDVEFGAPNVNMQNFKGIGSTMNAMAPPTLIANSMDMSLPMPDSMTPRSPEDNVDKAEDYGDLYASVDMSKKTKSVKESNNNNSNGGVRSTVAATIESDDYSVVGSSSSFSAHEEALAGDSPYSEVKTGDFDEMDGDGDYAVVKRVEETPKEVAEEDDVFGQIYAKVKK